jgi:uncharacterized membrane protein YccC
MQHLSNFLHPRFRYQQMGKVHAVRLGLAFFTSHLIATSLSEPYSVWMTVTVMMVMSNLPHAGSILQKGRQRFIGTTIGAIGGFLVIWTARYNPILAGALSVTFIAIGGYLAIGRGGYIAQMICLTVVIVASSGTIDVGIWRMANVYAGVALSAVFATLFPERARDHWYFMLEETIEGLNWLYRELARLQTYEARLGEGLRLRQGKMRALVGAAAREAGVDAGALRLILSQLHRVQITIEFLASEANDRQRNPTEEPAAETRIVAALQRLAQQMELPIGDDIPPLGGARSLQQNWLCATLANHLEELEKSLTPILPRLKGLGAGQPISPAWPSTDG